MTAFATRDAAVRAIADAIADRTHFVATVPPGMLTTVGEALARTCLHDPDPRRPLPIVASARRPGLVTCAPCAGLHAFAPGSVRDRTCDGCGYVTTGPEHDDGVYATAVAAGPFTYLLGACRDCRWWA